MTEISIEGWSIREIYDRYVKNEIVVNRKYQRKLVWSLDEKASLIESIQKGFPIPLILLAEIQLQGKRSFEVIDGLQRLDAIISFIEGRYEFNKQYFDQSILAYSNNGNRPTPSRRKALLDKTMCDVITAYKLPISVYRLGRRDVQQIDDVFLRINTRGKQLTAQEIRQAATLHPFAHLVRRVSSEIRGDTTASDTLSLDQMQEISISDNGLDYGINMKDIPWIRQKIFLEKQIRESEDEELVASILAYMLLHEESAPEPSALQSYYNPSSSVPSGSKGALIKQKLSEIGTSLLEQQFLAVHDEINKLLVASGYSEFNRWVSTKQVNIYYEVVFLTIYELFIRRSLNIHNYQAVAERLANLGNSDISSEVRSRSKWSRPKRQESISWLVDHLLADSQGLYLKRPTHLPAYTTGNTKIQNILTQVMAERTICKFKISCYPLEPERVFHGEEPVKEIYRSLTAIANQGPRTVGYVLVGVSDQVEEVEKYQEIYSNKPLKYAKFYITGVDDEALKYYKSVAAYYEVIRQSVEAEEIEPVSIKSQIVQDIGLYKYDARFVIALRIEAPENEPCKYEGKYYAYQGSNLTVLSDREAWERFM
ncbi:MAG: DUF262 domain-containing protein [Chloroflexota bacterium]